MKKSQKSFLDNKKNHERIFHMLVGGGGVNQHLENSICFVVFFLKASLRYCDRIWIINRRILAVKPNSTCTFSSEIGLFLMCTLLLPFIVTSKW